MKEVDRKVRNWISTDLDNLDGYKMNHEIKKSRTDLIQREEHLRQIELKGVLDWKIDYFDKISFQTNFSRKSNEHEYYFPQVKKCYKFSLEIKKDEDGFFSIVPQLLDGKKERSFRYGLSFVGQNGETLFNLVGLRQIPSSNNVANNGDSTETKAFTKTFGPLNCLHIRCAFKILDSGI